jgi:hypothetical protein
MSPSSHSKPTLIQRFFRWLLRSPFEQLPEPFGDPVPPELREFEAESEQITNIPRGDVVPKGRHHGRPHPPQK